MREIKFRVWDNVDYMSNPFTLQDLQLKKVQFASECPVMQFTGLYDKNGKEIYEGDIMEGGTKPGFVERGIYEVGSDKSGFFTWIVNYQSNSGFVLVCDIGHKCREEIVGNIYQSSELLK